MNLADLSVPLVYGVPADGWDAALGWDAPAGRDASTPFDDTVGPAIVAALEALDQAPPRWQQRWRRLPASCAPLA